MKWFVDFAPSTFGQMQARRFSPCVRVSSLANTTQSFLTKVLKATMEMKALELPSKLEVAVKTLPKLLVAAKASGAKAAGKGAVIAKQEKKAVKS